MALAKRNNKSNDSGWSVEQIGNKLGGGYNPQDIEKALTEFGSVSNDEELAIFQKMLSKTESVQQTTKHEAQPQQSYDQSVTSQQNLMDGIAAKVNEAYVEEFQNEFVEAMRPVVRDQAKKDVQAVLPSIVNAQSALGNGLVKVFQAQEMATTAFFDNKARAITGSIQTIEVAALPSAG